MAPTVQPSCYHKPGSDGLGVSEKEAKVQDFTNKTSTKAIPLKNYLTGEIHYDTLYEKAEKVLYRIRHRILKKKLVVQYLLSISFLNFFSQ